MQTRSLASEHCSATPGCLPHPRAGTFTIATSGGPSGLEDDLGNNPPDVTAGVTFGLLVTDWAKLWPL